MIERIERVEKYIESGSAQEVMKQGHKTRMFVEDNNAYIHVINILSNNEAFYIRQEDQTYKLIEKEKIEKPMSGIPKSQKDVGKNYYGRKNTLTGRWD